MSRKTPCHFFGKPGGCRKGTSCPFSHGTATGDNQQNSSSSITGSAPQSSTSSAGAPPPGVCAFFWRTGDCNRGFQCRYKHEASPAAVGNIVPSSSTTGHIVPGVVAPLFTKAAQPGFLESGCDALFSVSSKPKTPTEVQGYLRRFFYDKYQFRNALDVHAFVGLLTEANTNNSAWNPVDGELLLSAIAQGHGLLRINDVLRWEKVSTSTGNDKATLSFQRGFVPFLQYLSSDYVIKSTQAHLANALYSLIMENFNVFATNIQDCVKQGIEVARTFNESFTASGSARMISGSQVFGSLAIILLQCLTRIKNATAKYPSLRPLVLDLNQHLNTWISSISASPPTFRDPLNNQSPSTREQISQHLRNKFERLLTIVNREFNKIERHTQGPRKITSAYASNADEGTIAALHNSYVGPGTLRPEGPRHDNDCIDIEDIRIAPTNEELLCRIPPFLPANIWGAPHPLEESSMERILDTQYRLLREELTASLRMSIQLVTDDLLSDKPRTQLDEIFEKGGGKYRGQSDSRDTVLFNVYTHAEFISLTPDRRGLSVSMSVDSPPGRARNSDAQRRVAFWESMSSKRLLSGGLVGLVWQRGNVVDVHLGIISSSLWDHVTSARQNAKRVTIRVAFFDPDVELRIVQELRRPAAERNGTKLLVEATVMFASVRPFLEALRVEPTSIPFQKYLVHHPPGALAALTVDPPAYTQVPDFTFQLSNLFPPDAGVEDLRLRVSDAESVRNVRETMKASSRLDPSQADAIIDALTREVSLIQGPPGTGKSYTGVELLRVLLANGIGPILMLAYTNHALDHMLCSVLDAHITQKIVRLGSRSADERIAKFSIENMEEVAGKARLDRAFSQHHRELKQVQEEVRNLMKECLKTDVGPEEILSHLEITSPGQKDTLIAPPQWIQFYYDVSGNSEWIQVGKGGRGEVLDNTLYTFWRTGGDLNFLQASQQEGVFGVRPENPPPTSGTTTNSFALLADTEGDVDDVSSSSSDFSGSDLEMPDDIPTEEAWLYLTVEAGDEEIVEDVPPSPTPAPSSDTIADVPVASESIEPSTDPVRPSDFMDISQFFDYFGYNQVPKLPNTDRPLDLLADEDEVWFLSLSERQRLHEHWVEEVRVNLQTHRVAEFERLRQKHLDTLKRYNEGKDAARCELLRNVDIIGCTTTGAANLTALLKAIGPRVMLVEEAGQVLEAHVVGSLVPSVQQLILIGDPKQLRPTITNYALSMDHKTGSRIYKFDMSLMERLSSSGFPMSQIDVQRRMRPVISDLIRQTLYPKLEDHAMVQKYPDVQGMGKNLFFMTHKHKENGGDDDAFSKYNQFEVDMAVDLVMYLLRQGPYSAEGDIVVLCAYLGQLQRLRDALSHKVAVVIDERDQRELADREADQDDENTIVVEQVKVTKRVRLRTIDNFQGEEAKIVILTLVRNSGGSPEDDDEFGHHAATRVNVGFLKSENRTNVALSRAREGLYILGNATDLSSRSGMWKSMIQQLEAQDSIGEAFPVACQRHRDHVQFVSNPGELPRIAPDGGCLKQCGERLDCGHNCPYKCHSDDPGHVSVRCEQRCTRLCPRGHPCSKACAVSCGRCTTLVQNVELPCGHIKSQVACSDLDNLVEVVCEVVLKKQLPGCEHSAQMRCSDDPAEYRCQRVCDGIMSCCGRSCQAKCSECQQLNNNSEPSEEVVARSRVIHCTHPCERRLYCEHTCGAACSVDHHCVTECKAACRQICPHARCRQPCSVPCAPCQEPCTWRCAHQACPLPCGSICARLPCDVRCTTILHCGHQCPSVCGEDCAIQVCPICLSTEEKTAIVDMILQRTLDDVDPDMETLDELLITLPNCGHVFTVETLDGHCSMHEYYKQDKQGKWVGLEAPPIGFRMPPTCPTCRTAIISPRYGRIFKRADLDILENNVASHMSKSLSQVLRKVDGFSKAEPEARLQSEATSPNFPTSKRLIQGKSRQHKRNAALQELRGTPMTLQNLDPSNVTLHGIPVPDVRMWRNVTRDLLNAYRDAWAITNIRSAHARAWEASFSYLYQVEMDSYARDPSRAPRNSQEHAMRMARLRVGQPQPRADKRFLVEAFWTTINIRLTLADLTKKWIKALASRKSYPADILHAWKTYVFFLFSSSLKDAEITLAITEESESYRQTVKTQLLISRIEFEQFNFNVDMTKKSGSLTAKVREETLSRIDVKSREAATRVASVVQTHTEIRRAKVHEEESWLKEVFLTPAKSILEQWQKLRESVASGVFYEPVTLDDLMNVVKGFSSEFTHTGHFYKCPRGHTFVIADCGGANQRSFCPECGAAIGGSGHQLVEGNTRDLQLEQLAREQGAQPSPWRWGV